MNVSSVVQIVHCIDTEGPIYESLEATFERIKHLYHVDIAPSKENLRMLQKGEHPCPYKEAIKRTLNKDLLNYNDNWDKIYRMVEYLSSNQFRHSRLTDSFGGGWIYNWFCVDHVGYDYNPRERVMGYHKIFDRYSMLLDELGCDDDTIQFHFHPHTFNGNAHHCATRWLYTDKIYQILSRRIIDRLWFPTANRPGYQVNRPDSNWFLEQFIPFDYSSMAMEPKETDKHQYDFSGGRSGDWRRAPRSWTPYHPSHDDYQVKGNSRRWIARCLNIGTRAYLLDQESVDQAFEEAMDDNPVVLSFTNHDFRNMVKDIFDVMRMIKIASEKYPEVKFKYNNAVSALREALNLKEMESPKLHIEIDHNSHDFDTLRIYSETDTFGPQPFFCVKTRGGKYYYDNLDFQVPRREWTYTFDSETFPLRSIEFIGIATNNAYGKTSVLRYNVEKNLTEMRIYNE